MLLNKLRKLKQLVLGHKPTIHDEKHKALFLMLNDFFESHKKDQGFWYQKEHVKKYLTPKRMIFNENLLNYVNREIDLHAYKTCLDVGCGSGYLLYLIAKRHPKLCLYASDYNHTSLDLCRYYVPNLQETYLQNIYQLTIEQKDVVFCTEVLEHMTEPEIVLNKLVSTVRKGGKLILTVPDGREDTTPAGTCSEDSLFWNGHVNFWSPESWQVFIRQTLPELRVTFFRVQDYGYTKNGVIIHLD